MSLLHTCQACRDASRARLQELQLAQYEVPKVSWHEREIKIWWGPGIVLIRIDCVHAEAVLDATTWLECSLCPLASPLGLHTEQKSASYVVPQSVSVRGIFVARHFQVPYVWIMVYIDRAYFGVSHAHVFPFQALPCAHSYISEVTTQRVSG